MNELKNNLSLKLDHPHLIPILSRKVDSIYNQYLHLKMQVQQGDMKTVQALSDLKVEAMQCLETVEDYLGSPANQLSRAYLFSTETLLLNIISNHQTSKINELQSYVPWKKAPSKLLKKDGFRTEAMDNRGDRSSSDKLSKSSSKRVLNSCLNTQNTKRFLNYGTKSFRENNDDFSSRSSKEKQSFPRSPLKRIQNRILNQKRDTKGEQEQKRVLQSVLTVKLTEQDYREVLRMKSELGIE